MVAHRAYWPALREPSSGGTNLLYFAAAVPTVGFVHGPADVNPLNEAMLESYEERCLMNHGSGLDTVAYRAD